MTPKEAEALEEQGRSLRRLARALVQDPAGADDVVQEAYVLAMRRRKLGAVAWLRGVVRNKAREHKRADARRHAREARAASGDAAAATENVSAAIEEQGRVMTALGRVPEPFRTAVWMRYLAGHATKDVAEALGVPPTTVRTRVHRGLEHLREQLDAAHGGDRKTWQALLIPLLWEDPPVPLVPDATGGSSAGWGSTVATAAALGVGVIVGVSVLLGGSNEERVADSEATRDFEARQAPTLTGRDPDGPRTAAPPQGRSEGAVLRGCVRPVEDRLPDALQVYVIAKDAQFHTRPQAHVEPDAEGRFDLAVTETAGHWIAAISADGVEYGAVDGDAWTPERPLVVPLTRPPQRTVRVLDRKGMLVPNLLVWFLPLGDELRRTWPRPEDDRFTTFTEATDERGELRVRVPTRGTYRIRVRDRLPVTDLVVEAGEGLVTLWMRAGSTVRLTLENWTRQDPTFVGRLENLEDPGVASPAGEFRRGVLTFDNVPAGHWRIRAHAPTHRTTTDQVAYVTGDGEDVSASTQIHRRYDIGSLSLELYDPEGLPLPSGKFWNTGTWLRSHDTRDVEWTPRQPNSRHENRMVLRGVTAGTYDLFMARTIHGRLLSGAKAAIQIVAGQESHLRLEFRPAHYRHLPDLGGFVVAHRRLVHAELGDLPVLSNWTRRTHPVGGLPLEGSEIGPYPEGPITLELWDPMGRRRVVPLVSPR